MNKTVVIMEAIMQEAKTVGTIITVGTIMIIMRVAIEVMTVVKTYLHNNLIPTKAGHLK